MTDKEILVNLRRLPSNLERNNRNLLKVLKQNNVKLNKYGKVDLSEVSD